MTVSAHDFKTALGQFASGVTVVTTRDAEGQPLGLTISSFCSVSLEPPLVLVCVDLRSETNAGFEASKMFGLSVLAEGQEEWSRRFASGGPAKFGDVTIETGTHGVVLVPGALAHLECRVTASYEAGDHVIYVGEVVRIHVNPGRPLVYQAGAYRRLGAETQEP
jgi:flavin reductase (DIM6/NTAB) family NADH-FMN oxidoreductase RutF